MPRSESQEPVFPPSSFENKNGQCQTISAFDVDTTGQRRKLSRWNVESMKESEGTANREFFFTKFFAHLVWIGQVRQISGPHSAPGASLPGPQSKPGSNAEGEKPHVPAQSLTPN